MKANMQLGRIVEMTEPYSPESGKYTMRHLKVTESGRYPTEIWATAFNEACDATQQLKVGDFVSFECVIAAKPKREGFRDFSENRTKILSIAKRSEAGITPPAWQEPDDIAGYAERSAAPQQQQTQWREQPQPQPQQQQQTQWSAPPPQQQQQQSRQSELDMDKGYSPF